MYTTKFYRQYTYFFSRLPAPVSRNPFANGLLSIFSCVICKEAKKKNHEFTSKDMEPDSFPPAYIYISISTKMIIEARKPARD